MCEKLGAHAFHPACEAESERGYASGMGDGQDKQSRSYPSSSRKGDNSWQTSFVAGFSPPTGTLTALKWTSTQLCGSGKAQGLDGPYIVSVSQFPKPFLFIWKDSICKTFIQGLIANKSLHGATPLKGYTMAWPDNQCPIHTLISRDKMEAGELAHRLQEPLSLSL